MSGIPSLPKRIYLDHAATSWPKSDAVLDAMTDFARRCGAASGRGGYRSAQQSDQTVARLRRSIMDLIGAPSPECISLHSGGTAALNAAIHGIVKPDTHVVTTAAEHNSVLRPLEYLKQTRGVRVSVVPVDQRGIVEVERLIDAVKHDTALVAITTASNVTGMVQPIESIAQALREHSALLLCDAAQTFGVLPIDVQQLGIDLLAAPGHKASGGPAGTGFLYAAPNVHESIEPSIQGGTGSVSESLAMPRSMPSKLEAGNLNVPAFSGWLVALEAIQTPDTSPAAHSLVKHHQQLAAHLHAQLANIDGIRVIGEADALPIASLVFDGLAASDAAMILDSEYGIEVRSGLHCAALIHSHLDTEGEGTLRISGGTTTTIEELDIATSAIRTLAESLSPSP